MSHPSFSGREEEFERLPRQNTESTFADVNLGIVCNCPVDIWDFISASDKLLMLKDAVSTHHLALPNTCAIWTSIKKSAVRTGFIERDTTDADFERMDLIFWVTIRSLEESFRMPMPDLGISDSSHDLMDLFSNLQEYRGDCNDLIAGVIDQALDELGDIFSIGDEYRTNPELMHRQLDQSILAAEFLYRRSYG